MSKKFTHEDALQVASSMRNSLKIQNEIGFGDMNIDAPDIDFYPDNALYYDPRNKEIHLGVFGIVDIFGVTDEADFVSATNYGRGHEEQHCRSTAAYPYGWGIKRGCEMILEYISAKEEKSKRRFRNDSDYADFANRILPSMGIYISYRMLNEIIGGIANSIEDGRIERIRSARFPGFEKMRILYRGRFWEAANPSYKEWKDIKDNAAEKLNVIVNQILSLATCQLYTKGYIKTYAGTPMIDEVKALMPHIAKGVMAGRTRDMANEVVEISKKLAPYIYETCKLSQSDAAIKEALEKMLADMIKAMVDNLPENTGLSEKDEDTDEGGMNSTFPHSDLVVTLDDETYDKLMERSPKGDDSSGLMVRREHPKEEKSEEKNEENPSNGKSDAASSNQKGKDKPEDKSGQNGSEKKNCSKDESSDDQSESTPDKGEKSAKSSQTSASGNVSGETNADSTLETGKMSEGRDCDMDSVLKAMKEAAESVEEAAKQEIDNINASAAREYKAKGKVVEDLSKTITAEDVKGICPYFKELKRAYKLTDKLPPVLASRGKTLLRKNRQYFKSLSTPNVSFLDSGLVDPSRIYGLSFGDTEIFRKKGIDKKFDGCVYILIDNSGSMSGNKRIEACKAAAVIEESFRDLIPIKIVAFDERGTVIHEVIKGWNEQQKLNCCWNFCLHGRHGSGNADGYDIKIATKELLARPEQKKLLIVLSDGMPSEATPGFTKGAIEEARRQGIHVTGIYFEEGSCGRDADQFKQMYGGKGAGINDAICCELSELDKNLEAVMKKFSRS